MFKNFVMMKKVVLMTMIAFVGFSCNKESVEPDSESSQSQTNTNNNDWYIYEWYSTVDGSNVPISLGNTGTDHKLDFRTDNSIYYYIESLPNNEPASWGTYTSSTITQGTGGSTNSIVYQIISETTAELRAEKHENGGHWYLILKK